MEKGGGRPIDLNFPVERDDTMWERDMSYGFYPPKV